MTNYFLFMKCHVFTVLLSLLLFAISLGNHTPYKKALPIHENKFLMSRLRSTVDKKRDQ